MLSALMGLAVFAAVLAIFATTKSGRHVAGAASSEDVDFLLLRCGNDRAEALRRVAVERERFPDLCEADHHRRAIRKLLAESKRA